MPVSDVARKLKALRVRSGLSTAAISQLIGRPATSYASYENAYKKQFQPMNLVLQLAEHLQGRGDPPITRAEVLELGGVQPDFILSSPSGELIVGEVKAGVGQYHPSNVILAPDAPMVPDASSMPLDVPVFGTAQAGADGAFDLNFDGGAIGWVRRPPSIRGVKEAFAIYVEGTSMVPWRQPGAPVYIHKTRRALVGNHAIIVQDGPTKGEPPRAFIKKLVRMNDDVVEGEQYNPPDTLTFPRRTIKEVLRVLEWEELLGL